MTYNYTDTFRNAMELSFQKAKEINAAEVTPDLLLYGILLEGSSPCMDYLRQYGVEPDKFIDDYSKFIDDNTPRVDEDRDPSLAEHSRQAIADAVKLCDTTSQEAISPILLFRAILEGNHDTYLKRHLIDSSVMKTASNKTKGNPFGALSEALKKLFTDRPPQNIIDEEDDSDEDTPMASESSTREHARSSNATKDNGGKRSGNKTPLLSQFSRDITALAKAGKLDPVIGRTSEIERISQILGRRRKSNPILIGEPGVGKTSLVEGLAQRIVSGDVPAHLIGKKLLELDLSGLVAGTKYRGQFEERVKGILDELEASSNIIIYIDEIHTMVGAGGGSGSMDAANMMKPALARGGIQCIGATTLEEYRKHIEKDGALERRFQKVIVEPSTAEETLEILKQLQSRYEEHHQVSFSEEAIQSMVSLADRYLNDRFFPDKAIDLMDETGSRKGNKRVSEGNLESVLALEEKRNQYSQKKLEAIREQKFELAASYRNKEREIEQEISDAQDQLMQQSQEQRTQINSDDVAEVVAMMTSIPVQNLSSNDFTRLKSLNSVLKSRVIGQDEAVDKIARSIKRNRLGLRDEKRPIGSFLLLGPTGVGKTHLVKSLCEELFGSTDALIRVDMSEFMEKFAVSRLVGAPPGYVGYDEGGQLTEQVRRKPYSVVLFDEIEKAHPDVFNLLLQVLDEGFLTDSYGRKVDFRNTIIMITSNAGSRQAKDFGRGIGFSLGDNLESRGQDIMKKALNKTFSPEFLNRLDEIISFSSLSEDALSQIIELELKPLRKRLMQQGYNVELDSAAIQTLIKMSYSTEYGARPLRRVLQREIEDRLTDMILDGEISSGTTLHLTSEDDKIIASQQ